MCQVIYEMDMGAPTMRMLRALQPVFDEQGDLVYKQGKAGGMIMFFACHLVQQSTHGLTQSPVVEVLPEGIEGSLMGTCLMGVCRKSSV